MQIVETRVIREFYATDLGRLVMSGETYKCREDRAKELKQNKLVVDVLGNAHVTRPTLVQEVAEGGASDPTVSKDEDRRSTQPPSGGQTGETKSVSSSRQAPRRSRQPLKRGATRGSDL